MRDNSEHNPDKDSMQATVTKYEDSFRIGVYFARTVIYP